jgi:hypothetical protein
MQPSLADLSRPPIPTCGTVSWRPSSRPRILPTLAWPKIPRTPTRCLPRQLFAQTLAYGLQADYPAWIEKRNLASLHSTKEASASAQELLAVCHDCYDALLATGFSQCVMGSMAAPVPWILRMGGLPADKRGGMADLRTAAEYGHYLAPFARILLAIAYVRETDNPRAVQLLTWLQREFPGNTFFPREIAHLQAAH